MSSEQKFASLDPDDAGEGNPLFDSGDVEITDIGVEIFDYKGKSDPATGIRVKLKAQANGESEELDEFYRLDTPDKFVPSTDGKRVVPVGDAEQLWAKCDGVQFLKGVTDSGVPKTLLKPGDVTVLKGAKFHAIRVNKKDRAGQVVKTKKGYNATLVIFDKLISLPGEKAAASSTKKAAASAAAPKAGNGAVDLGGLSDELRDKVIGYIVDAVTKAPLARKAIAGAVFPLAMGKKDPDLKQVGQLAFDEGFLNANSGQPVQRGEDIIAFAYEASTGQISRAA